MLPAVILLHSFHSSFRRWRFGALCCLVGAHGAAGGRHRSEREYSHRHLDFHIELHRCLIRPPTISRWYSWHDRR